MMRLSKASAAIIAVTVMLAACAPEPPAPLVASDVRLSPARPGVPMRAAYMTLRNNTSEPIRITAATSPSFANVEMHETVIEDGIAKMRPLRSVAIPAKSELKFERGGKHLMLMRPIDDAAGRDRVQLDFFDGDSPLISVIARQDGQ